VSDDDLWRQHVDYLDARDRERLKDDPRFQQWERESRDLSNGPLHQLADDIAGPGMDYSFLPAWDALAILGPGALDQDLEDWNENPDAE
jgi:hypothetical protein